MLLTAWGSLHQSLRITEKSSLGSTSLLIRGGTSSVGYAAIALALKSHVNPIIATTRNSDKVSLLQQAGAHHVIIDTGNIKNEVLKIVPEGVSHVLELIGPITIPDSFACCRRRAIVCNTGCLGNVWDFKDFYPIGVNMYVVRKYSLFR
jgi:NADPH2:quinone reductase